MADDLPKATEVLEAPAVAEVTNVAEQKIDEEHEKSKSVKELMDEGNADMALHKYSSAAELFSLAVEKLVEKHGEMSVETVDALEVYGNALLQNAIASSAVLGNDAAANGKTAANDPSGKKDSAAGEASSSKAGPSTGPVNPQSFNFHFGGDADDDDEEDQDEDDEGAGDAGEEDTDDFENAWEILDSCRAILEKEESKDRKLQLARVHSSMAEVATESGRPEDGVKEYERALAIQSSLLPAWDRLVAQTHLFIALALELIPNNQFDSAEEEARVAAESYAKAMEHVEKAKTILRAREAHIKGDDVDAGKGKQKEGEPSVTVTDDADEKELSEKDKDEIKDIAELLGELDNKIDDLKSQSEEAEKKAKEGGGPKLQDQIFQAGPALPEGVSREVHNLNSMVKKKKKQPAPVTSGTENSAAPAAASEASLSKVDESSQPDVPASLEKAQSNGSAVNGKRKAEEEEEVVVNESAENMPKATEKRVRIEEPSN